MIPLKEDGKIDEKFIEILPLDDFEEIVEKMNWDQINYFFCFCKTEKLYTTIHKRGLWFGRHL